MALTSLPLVLASFIGIVANPQAFVDSCPDLSARYVLQGEDGRVLVTIKQDRCSKVIIKWGDDDDEHGLRLDGILRRDIAWFGARDRSGRLDQQLTSAQFRDKVLWLSARPLDSRSTGGSGTWTMTLTRRADGDLCSEMTYHNSTRVSVSRTQLGRLRGRTRAAEDEAANRSDITGCDASPTQRR